MARTRHRATRSTAEVLADTPIPAPTVEIRGRFFSRLDYSKALAAYLETPTLDAVRGSCGRRMSYEQADALIERGIPELGADLLPLGTMFARKVAARTKEMHKAVEKGEAEVIARALEKQAESAEEIATTASVVLGDAVEARKEEIRLVRANRIAGLVLARMGADLLRVGGSLARSLLKDEQEGKLKDLKPEKRIDLMRGIATIAVRTAELSSKAVTMERLLMGEPTAILGHRSAVPTDEMTEVEAQKYFELASRAFGRRAARNTPIEASSEPTEKASIRIDTEEDDEAPDLELLDEDERDALEVPELAQLIAEDDDARHDQREEPRADDATIRARIRKLTNRQT